jgi:hypothetical protein
MPVPRYVANFALRYILARGFLAAPQCAVGSPKLARIRCAVARLPAIEATKAPLTRHVTPHPPSTPLGAEVLIGSRQNEPRSIQARGVQ